MGISTVVRRTCANKHPALAAHIRHSHRRKRRSRRRNFWGGDYEEVRELIRLKVANETNLKFFLGYSGWGAGQLEDEMQSNSWYLAKATAQIVFSEPHDKMWRRVLRAKGGDYAYLANFPEDPRLN